MKTFLVLFLILVNYAALSQDCKVSLGTKTLYTPQQTVYTKPPFGYQPVFINHVGRHGARHLTKDLNGTVAYKMLVKAGNMQALTAQGQKIKQMVLLLQSIEAPGLKSISERGKSELQGIAERMIKNNAAVFKKNKLDVEITKEIRTAQSADAFLKGLHNDQLTSPVKKKINDTTLRFYDLSPAYLQFEENGSWKTAMLKITSSEKIKASTLTNFSTQFFTGDFAMTDLEKEEFCKDVYGFLSITPSIVNELTQAGKSPANLDFRSFFSCGQLAAMNELDEAEDFLLKGPGTDTLGLQVKIAVPLLVQFINTSDEFVESGKAFVHLRFAHAETISPFASLMEMVPASKPVHEIENFSDSWKASTIIPLSANIQWIFYKKPNAHDYLVKFLLNEKEVAIKGLSNKSFPYYKWNDVRKFYVDLLRNLGVSLQDEMPAYLQNLR